MSAADRVPIAPEDAKALFKVATAARAVRDWEPTVPARDDFDAGYDAGRLAAADIVRDALARLDAD